MQRERLHGITVTGVSRRLRCLCVTDPRSFQQLGHAHLASKPGCVRDTRCPIDDVLLIVGYGAKLLECVRVEDQVTCRAAHAAITGTCDPTT